MFYKFIGELDFQIIQFWTPIPVEGCQNLNVSLICIKKWCQSGVNTVCLVYNHKFSLKEFRKIDHDCHKDWWYDVAEQVHLGRVPQAMSSVEDWLTDCQVSFCGYADHQEGLQTQEDVFHGVQEVWEEDEIYLIIKMFRIFHNNKAQKLYVTDSKSNKALMEC